MVEGRISGEVAAPPASAASIRCRSSARPFVQPFVLTRAAQCTRAVSSGLRVPAERVTAFDVALVEASAEPALRAARTCRA